MYALAWMSPYREGDYDTCHWEQVLRRHVQQPCNVEGAAEEFALTLQANVEPGSERSEEHTSELQSPA